MSDLTSLETRLAHDKGYSNESPVKDGLPGFVCPRANGYGGREGIIPPGVAAVRGLVPKGLKHVTNADVGRRAVEAASDTRTDAERYRDYYGHAADKNRVDRVEYVSRPAQDVPALETPFSRVPLPTTVLDAPQGTPAASGTPTHAGLPPIAPELLAQAYAILGQAVASGRVPGVQAPPSLAPSRPPPPSPAGKGRHAVRNGKGRFVKASAVSSPEEARATVSPDPRADGVIPEENNENRHKSSVKEGVRMFSESQPVTSGDDTLEAFYEGLRGMGFGTDETDKRGKTDVHGAQDERTGTADAPVPGPRAGSAMASIAVALETAARDRLALEQDKLDLQETIDRLRTEAEALRASTTSLYQTLAEKDAEIQQLKKKEPEPAETVRLVLGAAPERLKVGGRGWACNVEGALAYGRERRDLVLTLLDPRYASELLAEIQKGEVAILSARGRTACVYAGHCAKIYGDADSTDFITCFRFRCAEETGA